MKLSIIVPTRNGSRYLPDCLATCLSPEDKELEVIVSDNSTGNETREAVTKISDNRLLYFNAGGNLSMRQNYEFALSKATGDYIIMIGDDDGVLKNGLQTLRFLIDKYRPDVVNWRILRYIWPHTRPEPTEGIVNFRRRDFFGPLRHIDPNETLYRFCRAETVGYKDGANLYHGCVARTVIEAVRRKTGEYFQAANPDMWASLANLTEAKSMLWIKNPVTIGGESEKSTGAGSATKQALTREQADMKAEFRTLANADTVTPEVNPAMRQLIPYTYAILNRVNRFVCENRLEINHQGWRDAIRKDMEGVPSVELEKNEEILQALFAELDPQYRRASNPSAAGERPLNVVPAKPKIKKQRRLKLASGHTRTVLSVARWIDATTGSPHYPNNSSAFATVLQWWKIFSMSIRTKHLERTQSP